MVLASLSLKVIGGVDVECFYYLINLSISRKPGFKEWHIWCPLGLFTESRFPCHSKYVHIRILYVTNISCFRVFVFKADWLLKHLIYLKLSVIPRSWRKHFRPLRGGLCVHLSLISCSLSAMVRSSNRILIFDKRGLLKWSLLKK